VSVGSAGDPARGSRVRRWRAVQRRHGCCSATVRQRGKTATPARCCRCRRRLGQSVRPWTIGSIPSWLVPQWRHTAAAAPPPAWPFCSLTLIALLTRRYAAAMPPSHDSRPWFASAQRVTLIASDLCAAWSAQSV